MNNKIITVLAIVLVVAGSLLFNKRSSIPKVSTEKVKVGVILPLSGALAEYGVAYKNGIMLASEQSKNSNVEYVFEDSDYDAKKSISAYNKLVDVDKVDVLMSWGGVPTEAVYPLLKDKRIPFLAGSSLSHVVDGNPYTVRVYDTPDYFASAMWNYFRAHNQKRIAIIKVEALYTNSILEALERTKNPDETITVVENYSSLSENDFRTSLLKVKQDRAKYDTLGVLIFGQIGAFYNQKTVMGLDIPTFGTDFFESKTEIDAAGKNINGAVFANFLVSDEFQKTYETRFGNVSQISQAGLGHDMALVVNQLTTKDADRIMKIFKSSGGMLGVIGSHNYIETKDDRYFDEEVHMKVIQDGKIMKAD
jgi:branched-chain amino acid transport system substrate-binding protein